MALVAGTVTVSDSGEVTATDSSMAKDIYCELADCHQIDTGVPLPHGPPGVSILRIYAAWATRFATGVVKNLVANADVIITVTDGGLQISTAVGEETQPPPADVVLSGTLE